MEYWILYVLLLLMGGWEVASSLSFTSEYFSTYMDYLVSAMSWHNGCTHQQVYKFRNDRWIEEWPLRSCNGRCASLHDRRIEARPLESLHDRYTDARACASFHQPLYGCKNWCQHNGWLMTTWLPNCVAGTEMLSDSYKSEFITETNYSLLNCKTFTGWSWFQ